MEFIVSLMTLAMDFPFWSKMALGSFLFLVGFLASRQAYFILKDKRLESLPDTGTTSVSSVFHDNDSRSSGTKSTSSSTTRNTCSPSREHPAVESKKSSINIKHKVAVDDLVCPITLELLFDPVTAADGRLYERSAIEKHIKSNRGVLKSPIANEVMGKRTVAAPQVRNHIQILIGNDLVEEQLASKWKEKSQQKTSMEDLLKSAEQGIVDAMLVVAIFYDNGHSGFVQDQKEAYKWYEKACNSGSSIGMSKVGEYLVKGHGVHSNKYKGLMYLGMAAGMGNNYAAYLLGKWLADGAHGLPVDKIKARELLMKCLSANPDTNMHPDTLLLAQKKLDEI